MKILEKSFAGKYGFDYQEVIRKGDFAVYSKKKPEHSRETYEVVKILRHNGLTIAGVFMPPAEFLPSNEQWGTLGFTYQTKGEAMKKFESLISHADKTINDDSINLDSPLPKRRGRPPKKR